MKHWHLHDLQVHASSKIGYETTQRITVQPPAISKINTITKGIPINLAAKARECLSQTGKMIMQCETYSSTKPTNFVMSAGILPVKFFPDKALESFQIDKTVRQFFLLKYLLYLSRRRNIHRQIHRFMYIKETKPLHFSYPRLRI